MARNGKLTEVRTGSFFICKVKYERVTENGINQKVNEPYIVKAYSFTEAEKEMTEYIAPFTSGDYLISDIKRCKFSEIIEDKNGQFYYQCIIKITIPNEKNGKEKTVKQLLLIQGNNVREVCEHVEGYMGNDTRDFAVSKIEETAIMDVCIND